MESAAFEISEYGSVDYWLDLGSRGLQDVVWDMGNRI